MYHVVILLSERRKEYKQTKNKKQTTREHSFIDFNSFDRKKKEKKGENEEKVKIEQERGYK